MKILRSHIFKIGIIILVCSGLMGSFVKSANASQSNEEFANWLQSLTKQVDEPELQQRLRSLKNANLDLSQLILRASQIVSDNNEDFNIPLKTSSDNIQHILLVEWNQYQTGSSMAAVPSVETLKPTIAPQHQKLVPCDVAPFANKVVETWITTDLLVHITSHVPKAYRISPMISGIAIGAP